MSYYNSEGKLVNDTDHKIENLSIVAAIFAFIFIGLIFWVAYNQKQMGELKNELQNLQQRVDSLNTKIKK
jgi:hypothetical protein